jgi:Protein of unknown function (DUF3263)
MSRDADHLADRKIPVQKAEAEHDDFVDGDARQLLAEFTAPPSTKESGESGLGELERDILAFERQWWKRPGAKEQAIRDTFGLSTTRYYQLLNVLLDEPAALEHEPVMVQRLRRLRASRTRGRR